MNSPVLLLNANFEPLNVCTTRRALGLMLCGKAELLLNGRGYVRSVREVIQRPSVIRLGYMVKRPRPRVRLSKRELLRRDDHTCQYCGRKAGHLTMDHIVPRRYGGDHSWQNLVTACAVCNTKKGGRTLQQAHMQLIRLPYEPPPSALYLLSAHLAANGEWRPYLEGW